MIRTAQRTLYGIDLQLHQLLGKQYAALPNTTLNEKFGILAGEPCPLGVYPTLKYFCIGIGGNLSVEHEDKFNYSEHSPIDAALFQHIPFVIREVTNDLTPDERLNYRFRCIENIFGSEYVCYYLKLLPGNNIKEYFHTIKTVSTGDEVGIPTLLIQDTSKPEILNPVPKIRSVRFNAAEQLYATKIASIDYSFTEAEIKDIKKAIEIKKLDGKAITEVGLCSGIDMPYSNYTESICTQIVFHFGITLPLMMDIEIGKDVKRSIEIGGAEPLLC